MFQLKAKQSCFLPTDDIQGWQDAVLKSLEKKHRAEQEFLMALLQDESSQGMREEARAISEDDRLKRLSELKGKREELDLGVKGKFQLEFQIIFFVNERLFSNSIGSLRNHDGDAKDNVD